MEIVSCFTTFSGQLVSLLRFPLKLLAKCMYHILDSPPDQPQPHPPPGRSNKHAFFGPQNDMQQQLCRTFNNLGVLNTSPQNLVKILLQALNLQVSQYSHYQCTHTTHRKRRAASQNTLCAYCQRERLPR